MHSPHFRLHAFVAEDFGGGGAGGEIDFCLGEIRGIERIDRLAVINEGILLRQEERLREMAFVID